MICLLLYFIVNLCMTCILFYVEIICSFFSISNLVNWVISDLLVNEGLKNRKLSHLVHMILGLILSLVLLKNRRHGFSMFTNVCVTFVLHKC